MINVSSRGVLVESDRRLDPGSRLSLKIVTPDQESVVDCRVVRAHASIAPDGAVCYRAGILFDREIALFEGDSPSTENTDRAAGGDLDDKLRDAQARVEEVWSLLADLQIFHTGLKQESDAREQTLAAEAEQVRREAERHREAAQMAELALAAFEEQKQRLVQTHGSEREQWTAERLELTRKAREADEQRLAVEAGLRAESEAERNAWRTRETALLASLAEQSGRLEKHAAEQVEWEATRQRLDQAIEARQARHREREALLLTALAQSRELQRLLGLAFDDHSLPGQMENRDLPPESESGRPAAPHTSPVHNPLRSV